MKIFYIGTYLIAALVLINNGVCDFVDPPVFNPQPNWPTADFYREGDAEIKLSCCVKHNYTTVTWTKDGKDLHSDNQYPCFILLVFQKENCWYLHIPVPKQSDQGYYTCEAENQAGNRNYSHMINVISGKQSIIPIVTSVTPVGGRAEVHFGDNITISCSFDKGAMCNLFGSKFQWKKNDTLLEDTYKHEWNNNNCDSDVMEQTLTIRDITESDLGDYKCYGNNSWGNDSKIITLQKYTTSKSTPLLSNLIIGVISGVGFVILVTITTMGVIIYRKRHSNELEWEEPNPEAFDVPDHQLEFDVFVSYSNDDEDWVKGIIFRNLEKQGYTVNIHFKDFVPGMAIAENIMDAVYKSRKTIVVMSKNFLKSMWGQFELQQAHNRAIAKRTDVLILIKFGKCKVPAKLMGKTFLDWTDQDVQPHFWERLYEAIGKPHVYNMDVENEVKGDKDKDDRIEGVDGQAERGNDNENEGCNGEGQYDHVIIDMRKQRGGRSLTKELNKIAEKKKMERQQNDVHIRQKERILSAEEEEANLRLSLEEKKPLIA